MIIQQHTASVINFQEIIKHEVEIIKWSKATKVLYWKLLPLLLPLHQKVMKGPTKLSEKNYVTLKVI